MFALVLFLMSPSLQSVSLSAEAGETEIDSLRFYVLFFFLSCNRGVLAAFLSPYFMLSAIVGGFFLSLGG